MKDEKLAELIRLARARPPMTEEERFEQTISFTFGNIALTKEYANATGEELEALRERVRAAATRILRPTRSATRPPRG